MSQAKGISISNRERLELLHRRMKGPFSVAEAAAAWKTELPETRRRVAYLAKRGWLSRVRHNSYTTVPLGAAAPGDWREDPWVVAAKTFAPCYLGGWTASEHWGFTEQIFREVIVVTSRQLMHRVQEIQGTLFRVKLTSAARMFGLRKVWRGQNQVSVSDPARTIVDLLDSPAMGGGMRHVSEIIRGYFESEERRDGELGQYAERFGNRTVFKRLGYLLEAMEIKAPELHNICRDNMSAGVSLLDPGGKKTGKIVKRWRLRINSRMVENAS